MRERNFHDWFWIGLLVFLQLLPIVAVFLNSVAVDWAGTILPDGYTLDHIRNITSDPRFNQSIVNSLIVAIGSLVITPLICVPAILVAHCYFPMLDKWMAGLVILPYAVPGIVLALGLLRLYSGNYGVVLNGTPWVLIFRLHAARRTALLRADQEQSCGRFACRTYSRREGCLALPISPSCGALCCLA